MHRDITYAETHGRDADLIRLAIELNTPRVMAQSLCLLRLGTYVERAVASGVHGHVDSLA
mgnify:CR=1 FL=1